MLISRATDPRNVELVGIPPKDLIAAVVEAMNKAGLDGVDILKKSCDITREFAYDPTVEDMVDRVKPRYVSEKSLPVKNRSLPFFVLGLPYACSRAQNSTGAAAANNPPTPERWRRSWTLNQNVQPFSRTLGGLFASLCAVHDFPPAIQKCP